MCTDALGKVSRRRHGRSYSLSRNHPQAYRTLYSPVGSFGSFSTSLKIRGALDASFSRLLAFAGLLLDHIADFLPAGMQILRGGIHNCSTRFAGPLQKVSFFN